MGLFSRVGSIWRAILNTFVSGLEDKYVIELAESQLQQATERLREGRQGLVSYQALVLKVQQQADEGRRRVTRLTAEIKAHLKAVARLWSLAIFGIHDGINNVFFIPQQIGGGTDRLLSSGDQPAHRGSGNPGRNAGAAR